MGSINRRWHLEGSVDAAVVLADIDENAINLRGVWNCMKDELRQMREQGSGVIVNCSSVTGLMGTSGGSLYNASKHGVIGLTRSVALEYASRGIRVNAV